MNFQNRDFVWCMIEVASRNLLWFALLSLFFIPGTLLHSQTIQWKDVSGTQNLPQGSRLWKGTRTSPALVIWALEVDLNNPSVGLRPYLGTPRLVSDFSREEGAYAAINGGFFGGSTSYSAVVTPDGVKAQNVGSVTRNGLSYPVMRGFFSIDKQLNPSIDWIYHYGNASSDIVSFAAPLQYTANDPSPRSAPDKASGQAMENVLAGIGGGPVLVQNGVSFITYNQEIMWGSGVGLSNRDARTAVGYTSDKRIFLITAEGRQNTSEGISLPELAEVFLYFSCTDALNLDGGGSSGMAVGGAFVSSPSEQRKVPSILALTDRKALQEGWQPTFEKAIDTHDTTTVIKGSWTESANAGYFGISRALISARGNGASTVEYHFSPPRDTVVQVYAWWVSSANRCKDTPIQIRHKYGETLLRADQTQRGSTWNFLGDFVFKGDGTDYIRINNQATLGEYVVADAFRLVSFGVPDSEVSGNKEQILSDLVRLQTTPNPANDVAYLLVYPTPAITMHLTITDYHGRVVYLRNVEAGSEMTTSIPIDTSSLLNGVYNISLSTPSSNFHTRFIVSR